MDEVEFEYIESPPNKWTFKPKKIRTFLERELEGKVLNLFAGETKLRHRDEIVRNDINENIEADYHFDALKIDEEFDKETFDTVILDPPYNVRKAREKYDGTYQGKFRAIKEKVSKLVRVSGKVLTFGYDSTGMSGSRGFKKVKIYLINHKGDHNDTICLVERRIQTSLEKFMEEPEE